MQYITTIFKFDEKYFWLLREDKMDLPTARKNISKLEFPFFENPTRERLLNLVDAWRNYLDVRDCWEEFPNEFNAKTAVRVYFGLMGIRVSSEDASYLLEEENGYKKFFDELIEKTN
jgi:hypothetical protein